LGLILLFLFGTLFREKGVPNLPKSFKLDLIHLSIKKKYKKPLKSFLESKTFFSKKVLVGYGVKPHKSPVKGVWGNAP
ncbi:MAG: hypothetical protein IKC69_03130, partial [Clostridia bacterium]|nr:hypothetical protein [Clostridia bacterium]